MAERQFQGERYGLLRFSDSRVGSQARASSRIIFFAFRGICVRLALRWIRVLP